MFLFLICNNIKKILIKFVHQFRRGMVYVVTRGYELENEKNNSPNQYTPNEHEYLQWS